MADPEQMVLAGILPSRVDRMAQVRVRLLPEHFTGNNRVIFEVLLKYYDKYGAVLEADLFMAILTKRTGTESAKIVVLEQLYNQAIAENVPDSRFSWAVDELIDRSARRQTGDAIAEAFEILERGWEDPKHPGEPLTGHTDARTHLYARLSEIDRAEYGEHAPEGDMRREGTTALSDYAARKEQKMAGRHSGVRSGIGCIDRTIGGLNPGELCLGVGYTTAGKSHLCTQWAWHVAVEEGQDVVFFTTETVRDQVKRRLYARHSRMSHFGRPGGLNSKDIRNGTLSAADEEVFRAVVDDLDRNPKYGAILLAQVPSNAPLSYVESRLREARRTADPKICVVDYLALIRSDIRRQRQQEEYNDVLRGAKQMATHGDGIPVISPWQVQQAAYREAMKNRAYGLTNLSDTSEAEKVSDTIIAILRDEDEVRSARIQFLKVRDGDLPPIQEVEIDFRCSYYGDRAAVYSGATDGAAEAAGSRSELEDFLNG